MKLVINVGLILLITLFFTVAGMFMNSFATKSASYQNLQDEVQQNNYKLDTLLQEFDKSSCFINM